MLPGLLGSMMLKGVRASSLQHIATVLSTTSSINIPNDVLAGDIALLVASQVTTGTSPRIPSTPTGFTNIASDAQGQSTPTQTGVGTRSARRVLQASDAGASVSYQNESYTYRGMLLIFRPDGDFIPAVNVAFNDASLGGLSGNINAPTTGILPAIAVATYASQGGVPPSRSSGVTMTEVLSTSTSYLVVRYRIYNAGDTFPSTISISMGDGGAGNVLQGFAISMAP